jgi:predicted Zn-dependent protease with MMP-like domain
VVDDEFELYVDEAIASLPSDLRDFMSNVGVVVEEEPPDGLPLLGLYQGVPLTRRSSGYAGVPPDKITIYRGPLERRSLGDPTRLRQEVRRVVLHEIAHHFGISDERLHELGAAIAGGQNAASASIAASARPEAIVFIHPDRGGDGCGRRTGWEGRGSRA